MIRKQIAVFAKLVADRFGGRLSLVEREDFPAGLFGELRDDRRGFRLVAAIGSAGAVRDLQRVNGDVLVLQFAQHLVERRLAAAVEPVADHDDRRLSRARHQGQQDFFQRRLRSRRKDTDCLFSETSRAMFPSSSRRRSIPE